MEMDVKALIEFTNDEISKMRICLSQLELVLQIKEKQIEMAHNDLFQTKQELRKKEEQILVLQKILQSICKALKPE